MNLFNYVGLEQSVICILLLKVLIQVQNIVLIILKSN